MYQLQTSRDAEIRQIRAYAFPTPLGIKDFESGKAPTGGINVRTMGQTPAYKIRGEVGIGGRAYPLRPDEDFTIKTTGKIQNSAFITPTNTFSLKATADGILNQPTIDAINNGETFRLYIWGRVDYEDVFTEPHWFTFCYSYDGISIREGNGVEPCPRHNEDDHR